jgi:hypothetical protein
MDHVQLLDASSLHIIDCIPNEGRSFCKIALVLSTLVLIEPESGDRLKLYHLDSKDTKEQFQLQLGEDLDRISYGAVLCLKAIEDPKRDPIGCKQKEASIIVFAGYESGHVVLYRREGLPKVIRVSNTPGKLRGEVILASKTLMWWMMSCY